MSEYRLPAYAEDAFDFIDASFFSGELFFTEEAMQRAEFYIGRWQRAIAQNRADNAAEEDQ